MKQTVSIAASIGSHSSYTFEVVQIQLPLKTCKPLHLGEKDGKHQVSELLMIPDAKGTTIWEKCSNIATSGKSIELVKGSVKYDGK